MYREPPTVYSEAGLLARAEGLHPLQALEQMKSEGAGEVTNCPHSTPTQDSQIQADALRVRREVKSLAEPIA
jgi:hypothetical protein